jgi:hypothetical protein
VSSVSSRTGPTCRARAVEAECLKVIRFEDEIEVERGRHTAVHVGPAGRLAPLPELMRERLLAGV